MKKHFTKILCISLLVNFLLKGDQLNALVPYYYLPTIKNLEKESLSIGRNAYQLLYFGQIKESLNLAKLAVKINKLDEKLWLILSESQVANKLYEEALISLKKAEKINPNLSEIYFSKSNIFIKQLKLKDAKIALKKGLQITPENHNAIFQLGNIFLMEKNYSSAINIFDKAVKFNPEFWQAINNQGLAYFEQDKINLSIKLFEKAIALEENAEPLLGLASCLSIKDINSAILLAKKALIRNPNYVEYDYRKEQLWGEKLQISTEKLLKNDKLEQDIRMAKLKINQSS